MNKWQKVFIVLIIFSFLGSHWQPVWQFLNSRTTMVSEVRKQQMLLETESIRQSFKKEIASGSYTPLESQRHIFRLRCMADSLEFGRLPKGDFPPDQLADSIFNVFARPRLYPNTPTSVGGAQAFKYKQEWAQIQQQVSRENKSAGVDWKKIFEFFRKLYFKFFPFAFLILLVKRWPARKFKLKSIGEVISFVLSLLFWPLSVFIYQPKNSFQRRFDYQAGVWKRRVGERGWKLGLAYAIAFFIAIFSTLKPTPVKAMVLNQKSFAWSLHPRFSRKKFWK